MARKRRGPEEQAVWAYAYEIVPPQTEHNMRLIRTLLEKRHDTAANTARNWRASFVAENKVTHILVISDSPDQDERLDGRIAVELKKLDAGFLVTAPLAVTAVIVPRKGTV